MLPDAAAPAFSLAEARRIVRDLFVPRPAVYWADFLTTISVGHLCYFLTRLLYDIQLQPLSLRYALQLATFAVQCACYYRAVMFVHEIVHLPERKFRAFKVVWNLLCGIPFLVPSFTYTTHLDHHRRALFGTDHDIPGESDCKTCHARQRSFALGFSALQLDHADGQVNLVGLADSGRLSAPPAGTVAPIFPLPGDATARAALGYLHGNCGPCHNPASDVQIRTPIEWHLETASLATVEDTTIYRTTVGVAPAIPTPPQYISVIEPGDPDVSVAVFRMSQRDPLQDSLIPMPPVATEEQDLDGIEAVSAWAASLP